MRITVEQRLVRVLRKAMKYNAGSAKYAPLLTAAYEGKYVDIEKLMREYRDIIARYTVLLELAKDLARFQRLDTQHISRKVELIYGSNQGADRQPSSRRW